MGVAELHTYIRNNQDFIPKASASGKEKGSARPSWSRR